MQDAAIMRASMLVTQDIHNGEQGTFHKELLRFQHASASLSMVRKKLPNTAPRATVLLVHGFGQNRYSWHISKRSFVNYLAQAGYDVFNLELRGHGRSGPLLPTQRASFEAYASEDLPLAIKHSLEVSGQDKLFLIGHSLGGALAYAAAEPHANRLRGIITFAGVFDYGKGLPMIQTIERLSRLFVPLTKHRPFNLQWITKVLAPRLSYLEPLLYAARVLPWHPNNIERPLLTEYLLHAFDTGSFDVLAEVFRWLRAGSFGANLGAAQRFFSVDVPLLVLSASRDLFNHPSGVKPAYDGSRSKDKTYHEFSMKNQGVDFGHVDIILGRDAPRIIWPVVRAWLDQRAPR
jgi:polyhydroxyalkanoate synthase subunit PhaC